MTKFLIGVINLFFIPMISVCITNKVKYKNKINFYDFIFQYCIYAVVLLLITSVFSEISNYLIEEKIYFYTISYTIVSLFCSILIPFMFINIHLTLKRMPILTRNQQKRKEKTDEKK